MGSLFAMWGGVFLTSHHMTLGVKAGATKAQIKKAFRKLAMKWHPDKNPDNEEYAKEQFQKVSHAHDVLIKKPKVEQEISEDDKRPRPKKRSYAGTKPRSSSSSGYANQKKNGWQSKPDYQWTSEDRKNYEDYLRKNHQNFEDYMRKNHPGAFPKKPTASASYKPTKPTSGTSARASKPKTAKPKTSGARASSHSHAGTSSSKGAGHSYGSASQSKPSGPKKSSGSWGSSYKPKTSGAKPAKDPFEDFFKSAFRKNKPSENKPSGWSSHFGSTGNTSSTSSSSQSSKSSSDTPSSSGWDSYGSKSYNRSNSNSGFTHNSHVPDPQGNNTDPKPDNYISGKNLLIATALSAALGIIAYKIYMSRQQGQSAQRASTKVA